jgi:hypothetical protein
MANKVYRVSETQFKNVMETLKKEREVTEGATSGNDSKYGMECKIDFEHQSGLTYHGNEIDDIITSNINVTFDIDMDGRQWGIKDISVYNVKGPSELILTVTYYPQGSDDSVDEDVTISLNWDDVEYDENNNLGYIGVSRDVIISLKNDENGGFMLDKIIVERFSI